MPAKPRSEVFDANEVGVYHCWNRVVRRLFLFGIDWLTAKDCRHRKEWVREQYRALASVMAIQVLDYTILDNHLHVVLRNRPDIVQSWSDDEVARRWWRVCPKRRARDGSPAEPTEGELAKLLANIGEYRKRLSDISWMMRLAQQRVARRANKEDDVDGRFFAKRFDCERLPDEASVLTCSLYVDLNWIHAGMADTPETSRYTSAYERIQARWKKMKHEMSTDASQSADTSVDDDWLAPICLDERAEAYVGPATDSLTGEPSTKQALSDSSFASKEASEQVESRPLFSNPIGSRRVSDKGFLPMTLDEYLQLLDTVGRAIRQDKRAAIPAELPPILERLGLKPRQWLTSIVDNFKSQPNLYSPAPS